MAPAPGWLIEEIKRDAADKQSAGEADVDFKRDWITEALQGAQKGVRNGTAARICGYFASKGISEDIAFQMMLSWNDRNIPPLERDELRKVVRSVYQTAAGKGRASEDPVPEDFCAPLSQFISSTVPEPKWLIEDIWGDEAVGHCA